jgi:hypothetical protein
MNSMVSLPDELSRLGNLEILLLHENCLPEPPVSVLRGLTSLTTIMLSFQRRPDDAVFRIPSPLLPFLHRGLEQLDLRQRRGFFGSFDWDTVSLFHLGRAMVEVADRQPRLKLFYKR